MREIKRTQYLWKNNQAFTLVEVVTALFVVSLASLLLLSSVRVVKSFQTHEYYDKKMEWYNFCLHLENQLSKEYFDQLETQRIITKKDNQTIYYEKYKNTIRRTTDKGGHEPLLTGVKRWEVFQNVDYIVVRVELESGEIYSHAMFTRKREREISSREYFSRDDIRYFGNVTLFNVGDYNSSF